MAQEAFDLAEQFQTPVFVMMDLDLGMNNWMSDGFKYPDKPINRGKVLTAEKLKKLGEWGRYKDVDGDGIRVSHDPRRRHAGRTSRADPATTPRASTASGPTTTWRTWTGCRASSRRRARSCRSRWSTACPARRSASSATARRTGRSGRAATSSARRPTSRRSYLRLRAYPFNDELGAFIDAHERVYVIEQNRDAQLLQLMKLELTPERQTKLRSVLHYNGLPIDARSITDDVLAQEGFEVAKKTVRTAGSAAGV